jgi:hypothetical protein
VIDKLIILAIGASIATGFGTLYDDDIPPPRFQRLGTLPVTFAKQDEINRLCGTPPAGQNLETKACSLVGKPHIVLADPCDFQYEIYGRRACHELAHALGGWPNTHPQ